MVEFEVSSRIDNRKHLLPKIESSEERGSSVENVKSAFTIYWLPLYLLKFPVCNLPLAQIVIDAENNMMVATKGRSEFLNRFKAKVGLINQDSNG
ncbi:hypothetical protein FQA39_LY06946 [Lamprigera yunnana]|nr:hypothetical protein FQA39_LY06946 [Lamprigera yunnana]